MKCAEPSQSFLGAFRGARGTASESAVRFRPTGMLACRRTSRSRSVNAEPVQLITAKRRRCYVLLHALGKVHIVSTVAVSPLAGSGTAQTAGLAQISSHSCWKHSGPSLAGAATYAGKTLIVHLRLWVCSSSAGCGSARHVRPLCPLSILSSVLQVPSPHRGL